MEEINDGVRQRIGARQIDALSQIAVDTGNREIFQIIRATMLFRPDVFNL